MPIHVCYLCVTYVKTLNIINTMSKTMILAIGGAGCNMAETIMRVANAYWVKDATYLFADSDKETLNVIESGLL